MTRPWVTKDISEAIVVGRPVRDGRGIAPARQMRAVRRFAFLQPGRGRGVVHEGWILDRADPIVRQFPHEFQPVHSRRAGRET